MRHDHFAAAGVGAPGLRARSPGGSEDGVGSIGDHSGTDDIVVIAAGVRVGITAAGDELEHRRDVAGEEPR